MTDQQKQFLEQTIQTMLATNIYDYVVQKLIYNLEQQDSTNNTILQTLKTQFPPLILPHKLSVKAPPHRYIETCLNVLRRGSIPFTNPNNIQFMTYQINLLNELIVRLGWTSIHELTNYYLIKYLEENIVEKKQNIQKYETKYQMTYQEMIENYNTITTFTDLDKEEDEMEWKMNIEFLRYDQELLNKILDGRMGN